ncbi:MAG: hydroxysqualene dehydroxylase, partial [Terriglobia bacterium]
SECYTEAAASFIRARQGKVELERNVTGFTVAAEHSNGTAPGRTGWAVKGARFADGQDIDAKTIVCTVPPFQLVRLLPKEILAGSRFFSSLAAMRPTPIISLNFWFDRDITDLEFAGLRGASIQWLFNRSKILRTDDHHVSVVISGAHEHIQREKEELLRLALGELRQLVPGAREARVLHSLIIKERLATFSPSIEAVGSRPPAVTPVGGLFLAGDWTSTGLPATIEGAVKSGYTAAAEILRSGG